MSWRDRPYSGDEFGRPELRLQLPKPSSVVGWLIVANIVVFLLDLFTHNLLDSHRVFGLSLDGIKLLAIWQLATYMFMHGGIWHILMNMLMLYVCGTEFERAFGSRRFIRFYAFCGVVGGLAYLVLSLMMPGYSHTPLVGASGAVYGLMIAAIIFFPHIQVVLFIFPVPIRVFGLIMAAVLLVQAMSAQGVDNLGGEVCHIAGAAAGVLLFHVWGMMPRIRIGSGEPSAFGRILSRVGGSALRGKGAWARRQKALADETVEVDRILEKVSREGIQSLSRRERKALSRATQHQRRREEELDRMHRL